ncbi:MAG: serine/threonine-protein kinase [Bradymonadaceae bacterium]
MVKSRRDRETNEETGGESHAADSPLDETVRITPTDPSLDLESADDLLDALPRLHTCSETEALADVEYGVSIGRGATNEVLRARQIPVGRGVAAKRSHRHTNSSDDTRRRHASLLREGWITGYLEHPNIVPVYRIGRDDSGEPVILMRHIEGVSWREILRNPSLLPDDAEVDAPLSWHIRTLVEVTRAVEYAHDRGILHRDLKPANVMIGDYGEIYVVDWGIAVGYIDELEDPRIPTLENMQASEVGGTPAYMAPELLRGETEQFGPPSDVYLLGGILHELLTGCPPHSGDSLMEVLHQAETAELRPSGDEIPDRLADITEAALRRNPDDRIQSAAELRRELVDYQQHRESTVLTERARDEFEALRDARRAPEGPDERNLICRFTQCRSTFEQALELSPGHEGARRGLQQLLEWRIEIELDRDAHEAARHFLAELPRPRPDLEECVDELGDRLESREREFQRLKKLRREHDLDIGKYGRSILCIMVGTMFAAADLAPTVLPQLTGDPISWTFHLQDYLLRAVLLVGGVYWLRDGLLENEVNRNIILAVLFLFGARGLTRLCGWLSGASTQSVELDALLLLGGGVGAMAVAFDPRLFWLAGAYLVGALAASLHPEFFHPIDAVATFAGTLLLALSWWPTDE